MTDVEASPEVGDGEDEAGDVTPTPARRPRRTAAHTRRVRTVAVGVVAVAAAVAVPLLVVKATRTIANSKAGRTSATTVPVVGTLPETPAVLLVEVGPGNEVAALTVLALGASGSGGAVVVVPAGTELATAGLNPSTRLASAYATGGLAAQRDALEGVLGITTAFAEEVDEAGLASLLAPYEPLHVVLEEQVLDTDGAGQERQLYPAGPVDLSAAQAARVLLARGPNESEITRLPRTMAVWAAALASGRSATTTTATTVGVSADVAAPTTVAGQLATIAGGTAAVHLLPVHPVLDAVANPEGLDLLAPDNAGQKLLMAEVMPGAISPANSNIRFQIVNASGNDDLLYSAVGRLVFVGANVVVVSAPSGTQQETVIEYQDPSRKAEASRYVPVVGTATVRQSESLINGIDATIVLGQDFATFMQAENAKSTTTTTVAATGATTTTAGQTSTTS
jgi:hypothetical protein